VVRNKYFLVKRYKCPVCRGDKLIDLKYKLRADPFFNVKKIFSIYRCKLCGVRFLNPIINFGNYRRKYPSVYYKLYKRRYLGKMVCGGTKNKYLEIGPGRGDNLRKIIRRQTYKEIWVVDIDSRSFKVDTENGCVFKYINSGIEKAVLKEGYFDYVYLSQVIEHVENPIEVISKLYKSLKNNGRMEIHTPNINSFLYSYCPKLADYSCPYHLFFFDKFFFERMFLKLGISDFKISYRWGNSLANSLSGKFKLKSLSLIFKFIISPISILCELMTGKMDNMKIVINKS